MQAMSGPDCRFVICCPTKSVENGLFPNHVKRFRVPVSCSCRGPVHLSASSRAPGQNLEERSSSSHRSGRRLFLSVMSGAAFYTFVERKSTALAAEEEISEPVDPESMNPEISAAEKPAVSEITASEEAAAAPEATAEGNALIRKLLARSKANKEKNDKARLDDYYKRNYKEYFEYIEGTIRTKKEEDLTEVEKGIIEWLKNNK